jgi:hypothetical protein
MQSSAFAPRGARQQGIRFINSNYKKWLRRGPGSLRVQSQSVVKRVYLEPIWLGHPDFARPRLANATRVRRAALALASTFDPNVLKKLGFPENVGEVTNARLWYERAQQLGSAEAPQRLEQLATVTNSGK